MLIVLTGKTASGKDTIIAKILTKYPNFKKILTTTSRAIREDERNGIDYNFISRKDFEEKINRGEFLEYVEYGGNFYGTEKSQINPDQNLIWKIDPSMAGKAKQIFPECIIIYITVDDNTVSTRLKERGLSQSEITARMQDDRQFFNSYSSKYDHIIENVLGKLEVTVNKVFQIIEDYQKNLK
ncbi:guanylate kinase [Candidatus Microgenomates bacterium]|nr:guanylate kinase [Candidatus Microgenomates bacterium]